MCQKTRRDFYDEIRTLMDEWSDDIELEDMKCQIDDIYECIVERTNES